MRLSDWPGWSTLLSPRWQFHFWLPLGIGLFMGAGQPGRAAEWSLQVSLMFWVVCSLLDWTVLDWCTRACSRLLRPFKWPLWAVLVAGALLGSTLFVRLGNYQLIVLTYELLPPEVPRAPLPAIYALQPEQLIPPVVIWLLANYGFYRLGGLDRYGFAAAPPQSAARSAAAVVDTPSFTSKLRTDRRGELLALNAQGHYLRVVTTAGEDLILHRFGDALQELGTAGGLQVHRSWWVSAAALSNARRRTRKSVVLANGLEVPVSRTYRADLSRTLAVHSG